MSKTLHASAAVAHTLQAGLFLYLGLRKDGLPHFPRVNSSFGKVHQVYKQQLFALVPTFSLLSAVNHTVTATSDTYYQTYRKSHTNPLQWGEYALSASLMLWIVATLSGLVETHTMVSLVGLNVLLQYLGYRIEVVKAQGGDWKPLMFVAFGIFFLQWEMIITSFYLAVTESTEKPPTIVYAIVLILFVLFSSFGINQLLYVTDRMGWETYQKVTVGLSLAAKSALIWMLYGGLVGMPQERIDQLYQDLQ